MNIGDYVRTKTGIHKIFRINENATSWKYHCDKKPTGEWDSSYEYIKIRAEDIIKSSPNIIDLIEVGDYVNGKKVEWIGYGMYQDTEDGLIGIGDKFILFNEFTKDGAREKDIKSIVTKEMFANAEYRVESN